MKKCSILLAAILSTVALVGCSGDKDKAPEKKEEAKTEVTAAPAGEHKDTAATEEKKAEEKKAEEKKADEKAAHADKDHADKKDEKKSEKDEEDDEDEE